MKKEENPQPGDFIEVSMVKKTYRGIFLESQDVGTLMIKLDSGYNIGLNKKDILDIKLLKRQEEKKEKFELKKEKEKPNIAMIITGGTIAARLNPRKGGVDWLDTPESLFKFYPDLFKVVNVIKLEVPFMKASEDMDYKDWQKIARISEKLLNDNNIQGIIITHGTDTLHYTSAALSFFLKNLNKPVVLTFSQRSIDRASSDANINLQCSALAAISEIAEVMLIGHATENDDFCFAMPGTKVRKMHTSRRDAFRIINSEPYAKIYPDRIEPISSYRQRDNRKKVKTDTKFEEKVALIKFYPGQDPSILDYYVKNRYKGIIIEMTGLGHVATKRARKGWTKKLKEVQGKGLFVCAVAQCINGRLDPLVYSNGREILGTGVIYLEDMLAETAFVKLSWALGHKEWLKENKKIKEIMLTNIAGEFSERLEE